MDGNASVLSQHIAPSLVKTYRLGEIQSVGSGGQTFSGVTHVSGNSQKWTAWRFWYNSGRIMSIKTSVVSAGLTAANITVHVHVATHVKSQRGSLRPYVIAGTVPAALFVLYATVCLGVSKNNGGHGMEDTFVS